MNVEAPKGLTLNPSHRAENRHDAGIRCEERGRIARELHDSTSQLLVALQLNLACLKQECESAGAQRAFGVLDRILEELHCEVRAVSASGLTPSLHQSLPLALSAMATHFALLTDIKIALDVQGNYVSQAAEVEMSLYRIAQEALANIARHAHAKKVTLQLDSRNEGTLKLTIEDDGVGFGFYQGARSTKVGNGIGNIRKRVRAMGGHLSLRQLPAGSRVAVSIHS